MAVTQIAVLTVAMKRMNEYLSGEEGYEDAIEWRNGRTLKSSGDISQHTITVTNGSSSWTEYGNPVLKDINVTIPSHKLIAIVGTVGSGKSSLLSTLLGEKQKSVAAFVSMDQ